MLGQFANSLDNTIMYTL